jgi:hypothetical protein
LREQERFLETEVAKPLVGREKFFGEHFAEGRTDRFFGSLYQAHCREFS